MGALLISTSTYTEHGNDVVVQVFTGICPQPYERIDASQCGNEKREKINNMLHEARRTNARILHSIYINLVHYKSSLLHSQTSSLVVEHREQRSP